MVQVQANWQDDIRIEDPLKNGHTISAQVVLALMDIIREAALHEVDVELSPNEDAAKDICWLARVGEIKAVSSSPFESLIKLAGNIESK